MLPAQDDGLRPLDRMHYMEAWLAGYLACRDGVPNDFPALMEAVKASYDDSGAEKARRRLQEIGAADA